MSTGPSPSEEPEWREFEVKWFRKPWVWLLIFAVIATGLGILAVPKAKNAYDRWSGERAVRRAAEFMAKGDIKHAMLDARRALEWNPLNVEANRIIAQALEAAGAPGALEWRQRLDFLLPYDAENLIGLAKDALRMERPKIAIEAFRKVKPEDWHSAAFHDLAALIAMERRRPVEAETNWKEAARLDPKEERYPQSLAALNRTALAEAVKRGNTDRAKAAAEALVSGPEAPMQDRLTPLALLRSVEDPESTRVFIELRDSVAAKPEELFQLLLWMNEHDLALLVVDWLRELPPDVVAKPPVCVVVADARARAMDWEKLKEAVESRQRRG